MMIERRARERLHVSLPARVGFGGRYRLRGVVLNLSSAGAKLALDKSADVPADFVLSVCYKGEERYYSAAIRWRRRETLGVALRALPAADGEWLLGLAKARRSEDAGKDEAPLRERERKSSAEAEACRLIGWRTQGPCARLTPTPSRGAGGSVAGVDRRRWPGGRTFLPFVRQRRNLPLLQEPAAHRIQTG